MLTTPPVFCSAARSLTAYRCERRGNGNEMIDRSFNQQERHLSRLGAGLGAKTCTLTGGNFDQEHTTIMNGKQHVVAKKVERQLKVTVGILSQGEE